MEETERSPVNFTIPRLSPAPYPPPTAIRTISSSSSQSTFGEGECTLHQGMASWIPLWTREHEICGHMGLGSDFRRAVRRGRYDFTLQAALVLSLQGVTKVRESQMSIELLALPLKKFAVEIFLPLYI